MKRIKWAIEDLIPDATDFTENQGGYICRIPSKNKWLEVYPRGTQYLAMIKGASATASSVPAAIKFLGLSK